MGKGAVLWLTGLSGAGKTTIAKRFVKIVDSKLIDSDEISYVTEKKGCFTEIDRKNNQRLIINKVLNLYNQNYIVLLAFISPFKKDREFARSFFPNNFFEIFVDASIDTCRKRDPKHLYKKFNQGKIKYFAGCNVVYEIPDNPDLIIKTEKISINDSVQQIINFLEDRNIINDKMA